MTTHQTHQTDRAATDRTETIVYEWDVETIDAWGDVVDHDHYDTFREARSAARQTPGTVIALVRDDRHGRSWAYMTATGLEANFRDAYGHIVAPVPQRFQRETM